ncbi:MAG: competence protein CoiA [Acidobacteria bacterium]|nr:MAG: competence protein CoiA [Acidobacteriota bacterium]
MLTAIRERDGQKLGAWEAHRDDRPFVCFCCQRVVTLRRGHIIAPHFAHQPPVTCEYGTGESEAHRRCKIAIYESLCTDSRVTKCELERNLGTVRPDVSAYINGVPVAIEVQLSTLSLEKIAYRTSEYRRKGIYVLWLPVYHRGLDQELYSPRPWERWLHATYFGRVYYWLEGATVLPVRFRDYYLLLRGRTRDYQKLSRRKVLITGQPLNLIEHFKPFDRDACARQLRVPNAKLMIAVQ